MVFFGWPALPAWSLLRRAPGALPRCRPEPGIHRSTLCTLLRRADNPFGRKTSGKGTKITVHFAINQEPGTPHSVELTDAMDHRACKQAFIAAAKLPRETSIDTVAVCGEAPLLDPATNKDTNKIVLNRMPVVYDAFQQRTSYIQEKGAENPQFLQLRVVFWTKLEPWLRALERADMVR